jgi:hypothetical protein
VVEVTATTKASPYLQPGVTVPRLLLCTLAVHGVIVLLPLVDLRLYGPLPLAAFVDLPVFLDHASKVLAGAVPYRDFVVEYPPLALLIFLLPRLVAGNNLGLYAALFALQMLLWDALCLSLVVRRTRSRAGPQRVPEALLWYTCFFAALYPFVAMHFDLIPATVAFAAAIAWASGRPTQGGFLAAAAAFLKVFPAAVALPGIVREIRGRGAMGWRGTLAFTLVLVVGGAAWWASGAAGTVRYHATRGLEIESLWAGAIEAGAAIAGARMSTTDFHGGRDLVAPGAAALASAVPLIQGIVLFLLAWRAWRIKTPEPMCVAGAAVLACVVTGKIFSPQYMVWLLPFAAVLGDRWTRVLFLLASALTTAIFPWQAGGLATLMPWGIALLNIRNALLVALLGVWLIGMPRTQSAHLEEPVASGRPQPLRP